MLGNLTTMGIEIVGCILLAVVIMQGMMLMQLRKAMGTQQGRIKELKNEMQALLLCSRGVGEKLQTQQKEVYTLRKRIDTEPEPQEPGYKQAIALMKLGASEHDTINTCDLTRGEVELIAHLQKTAH